MKRQGRGTLMTSPTLMVVGECHGAALKVVVGRGFAAATTPAIHPKNPRRFIDTKMTFRASAASRSVPSALERLSEGKETDYAALALSAATMATATSLRAPVRSVVTRDSSLVAPISASAAFNVREKTDIARARPIKR